MKQIGVTINEMLIWSTSDPFHRFSKCKWRIETGFTDVSYFQSAARETQMQPASLAKIDKNWNLNNNFINKYWNYDPQISIQYSTFWEVFGTTSYPNFL